MSYEWLTDIPERWYTLEGRPEIMYGLNLSKDESHYRFFLIKELLEVYVNEGHHEYISIIAKSKNIFLQDKPQFVNICRLLQKGLTDNKVYLEETGDSKDTQKKVIKMDCIKNRNVILDWRFELSVSENSQLILRNLMFQQFNIAEKLTREQMALLRVINLKDNIIARFLENKNYLPANLQNYIKKYELLSSNDDHKNGSSSSNMLNEFDFKRDLLPLTLTKKLMSIWDVISDLTMKNQAVWKSSNIYYPIVCKKSYSDSNNDNRRDNIHNNTSIHNTTSQFDSSNSSFSDLNEDKKSSHSGELKQEKHETTGLAKVEKQQMKPLTADNHENFSDIQKSKIGQNSSESTPRKKRTILGKSAVKLKKLKK